MALSLSPQTGINRLADQIRRNTPRWLDTRAGSPAGGLLAAMGEEDHRIGGEQPDTTLDSGTSSASAAGSLTDAAKTWAVNEWQGGNYVAEMADGTRYDVLSNTPTVLTLDTTDTPTAVQAYEIIREGSGVKNVQYGSQVRTATGRDLEWLAAKYGVYRPDVSTSDATFQAILPWLALELKLVRPTVEGMLTALLGAKASAGWDVFEIRQHELIVELPINPLGSGDATYLIKDVDTAITGTLTTSGGVTVTGVGTNFVADVVIGEYITSAGQTRQVVSVADATHLDTNSAFSPNLAADAFTIPRPPVGSETNPTSSYMAEDDSVAGPPHATEARSVVLGGEDHGNAGLVKQLLDRYIVSAGVVVTVVIRGS